jgi:hypothetical protein
MTHPLEHRADRLRERLYRATVRAAKANHALRVKNDPHAMLSELIPLIGELQNLHGECAAIVEHFENKADPS